MPGIEHLCLSVFLCYGKEWVGLIMTGLTYAINSITILMETEL